MLPGAGGLEMCTRYKDEEDTERHRNSSENEEGHRRPRAEQFSDEWLSNSGPIHEGIFAEAEEGHNKVELVLVADEEIGANGEWQNEPTSDVSWLVGQDHVVTSPKCGAETGQPHCKPNYDTEGHKIPSALACKNPGKASRSIAWNT